MTDAVVPEGGVESTAWGQRGWVTYYLITIMRSSVQKRGTYHRSVESTAEVPWV
jgi:hypothetical protein